MCQLHHVSPALNSSFILSFLHQVICQRKQNELFFSNKKTKRRRFFRMLLHSAVRWNRLSLALAAAIWFISRSADLHNWTVNRHYSTGYWVIRSSEPSGNFNISTVHIASHRSFEVNIGLRSCTMPIHSKSCRTCTSYTSCAWNLSTGVQWNVKRRLAFA